MSSLPDKGEKLRKQVDDVERALKAVNRKIANVSQYSGQTAKPDQGLSSQLSIFLEQDLNIWAFTS